MSHHEHARPKRWAEGWHQTIGVSLTVLLIFASIYLWSRVPMSAPTAQEVAKLGLDQASRLSNQERAR